MQFRLSAKFLAAFIGVILLASAIIFTCGYFAIHSGLRGAMAQLHYRHLESLAHRLGDAYERTGSWKPLLDGKRWLQVLGPQIVPIESPPFTAPRRPPPGQTPGALPRNQDYPPGQHPPPAPHGTQPGAILADDFQPQLLDAHRQPLNRGGPFYSAEFPFAPIYARGELVGYIGFPPGQNLRHEVELGFSDAASSYLITSFILAIVLAALVALFLARHLLKPIRQISTTVHQLASGDFKPRIQVTSRDELAALAADINFLANALSQNKTARHRWITDLAHELRTPLSILSAEVESAQQGLNQAPEDMLHSMAEEIQQLNNLIGDLRTLAQADVGELTFTREILAIKTFMGDYCDKLQVQLHSQKLELDAHLEVPKDTSLFVDPHRLKQLLDNLAQNSRRYTQSGGLVQISLSLRGNQLQLRWEDTEPGVSQADLALIFERLYRADNSRNRSSGGSGLGLAICKNIMEAENGHISAEASPLGGLAIICRWPVNFKGGA